jgi:hypothetical protein
VPKKKGKGKEKKKGKLETEDELKCFSSEVEIDRMTLRREKIKMLR